MNQIIEDRLGVKTQMGFTKTPHKKWAHLPSEKSTKSNPGYLQEVSPFAEGPSLTEVTPLLKEEQKYLEEEESLQYEAHLLSQITSDDLLSYGLIPEFVGRLPVVVNVEPLGHAALMRILTEPRNSITKQFQHLFDLDDVELVFSYEALSAAASLAFQHKTGARGLRSIIEEALLDVMYEIPSRKEIKKCIITSDVIRRRAEPELYDEHGSPVGDILDKAA